MQTMLEPDPWQGSACPDHAGFEWTHGLANRKIYYALFQQWPKEDLPPGYEFYIVAFNGEAVDLPWLQRQSHPNIICLFDGQSYGYSLPNVTFLPFYYWHRQCSKLVEWFPQSRPKNITYKISSVCNRITQSKLIAFTAVWQAFADKDRLVILHNWLEEKSIHYRQPTGNQVLDNLADYFYNNLLGTTINAQTFINNNRHNADPWTEIYQDCAIHLTNESFHYSFMQEQYEYIHPGPYLSEKTFKCLVGATAFLPIGQFDTYGTLSKLGFEFNYPWDQSWDQDPGNLSRLEKLVEVIRSLDSYTANDLYELTVKSSLHNQNHILSGEFFQQCERANFTTIEKVYAIIE